MTDPTSAPSEGSLNPAGLAAATSAVTAEIDRYWQDDTVEAGHDLIAEKAIRAYLAALASQPVPAVAKGWRCFHCDEVFTNERCARNHFGRDEMCEPACQIQMGAERSLLSALRRAEDDCNEMMQRMETETTDGAKAYYAQTSRHQQQLRTIEELGYERGLRDAALAPAVAVNGWCQPLKNGEHQPRQFIVYYEDARVGIAAFENEADAREHWEKSNLNWNCYLFGALPLAASNSGSGR
ncbi:hypothetical protein [Mesorhizobium onobrychidis]|uniref:C2H2-type domain-containing protein n=1 Tax=Mesorhizobium onobrychidis TaxID=2775404 RepID=A0ABY5QVM8_9HYPH|nr:hypothetical protein [Mesorhizobium onobrychidis]UVC14756.1 hypothetical protein IHQ72_29770 [Mesorhizobium onobrychidis]